MVKNLSRNPTTKKGQPVLIYSIGGQKYILASYLFKKKDKYLFKDRKS